MHHGMEWEGGQIYCAIITEEGEQIYSAILTGDQIPVTGRHKHEHTEKLTYRGLWVLGIPPKNETWSKWNIILKSHNKCDIQILSDFNVNILNFETHCLTNCYIISLISE